MKPYTIPTRSLRSIAPSPSPCHRHRRWSCGFIKIIYIISEETQMKSIELVVVHSFTASSGAVEELPILIRNRFWQCLSAAACQPVFSSVLSQPPTALLGGFNATVCIIKLACNNERWSVGCPARSGEVAACLLSAVP